MLNIKGSRTFWKLCERKNARNILSRIIMSELKKDFLCETKKNITRREVEVSLKTVCFLPDLLQKDRHLAEMEAMN